MNAVTCYALLRHDLLMPRALMMLMLLLMMMRLRCFRRAAGVARHDAR